MDTSVNLELAKLTIGRILDEEPLDAERIDVEIKTFLNPKKKANHAIIAKAVAALANGGGGIIIIGFIQNDSRYREENSSAETKPSVWNQTELNRALGNFLEPNIETRLTFLSGKISDHPCLLVPSHGSTPIIFKRDFDAFTRGTIFIRRPGPESAPISSYEEWRELIERCTVNDRERLASIIRRILIPTEQPTTSQEIENSFQKKLVDCDHSYEKLIKEHKSDIPKDIQRSFILNGRRTVAFQVFPPKRAGDLNDLRNALLEAVGRETGWPHGRFPSPPDEPKVINGGIESFKVTTLRSFPSHTNIDFWQARPSGFFYATRVYEEDRELRRQQKCLIWNLPIWRLGEAILHAVRFANAYSPKFDTITGYVRFDDLAGRILACDSQGLRSDAEDHGCNTMKWHRYFSIPSGFSTENLPDLLREILKDFYAHFDFFNVSLDEYEQEINAMIHRRVY
ncbi:MAG: hypothetical protein P9M14_07890 [Candidatus Alcyoniella australis]|nr:hypothetical protein [Candidatus Alcyoniella australis]